jgi:hypothetical protein
MADGALRRLFWRAADAFDYLLTLAWLRLRPSDPAMSVLLSSQS